MKLYQNIIGYTGLALGIAAIFIFRMWRTPRQLSVLGVVCAALFSVLFSENVEQWKKSRSFFNECRASAHIDARYCAGLPSLSVGDIQDTLRNLLAEFMSICDDMDIKPLLLFGGLIGWQFNQQLLPFDDDLDMAVTRDDVYKMVDLDGYRGDDFFIEVNPHWQEKPGGNGNNKIDARVISSRSGVFIDIVFFLPSSDQRGMLQTKNKADRCPVEFILPPQQSKFEGVDVWVPADPSQALVTRYGKQAILPTGHGPPGPERRAWSFVDGEWQKEQRDA